MTSVKCVCTKQKPGEADRKGDRFCNPESCVLANKRRKSSASATSSSAAAPSKPAASARAAAPSAAAATKRPATAATTATAGDKPTPASPSIGKPTPRCPRTRAATATKACARAATAATGKPATAATHKAATAAAGKAATRLRRGGIRTRCPCRNRRCCCCCCCCWPGTGRPCSLCQGRAGRGSAGTHRNRWGRRRRQLGFFGWWRRRLATHKGRRIDGHGRF